MGRNRTFAGLYVHKVSIYLCLTGQAEGITIQKTFGVLPPEPRQMREDMLGHGLEECVMESTAVYWVPVWNGSFGSMETKLANPYYFIRQLPGCKSDVKYTHWIAGYILKKLVKGRSVPHQ